ncbi:hypothetical protein MTO96_038570, partial [Rhipicephalus appendiculatus]
EPTSKSQAATEATAARPNVHRGPTHPAQQQGVNVVPTAGIAFPQPFYLTPQGHGAVGTENVHNLVAQAPPEASVTGQAVQRHPMVPAAPVAKPAVHRRKQRSTAAGRHAKKKLAAASTGRKSRGGRKSASVGTTAVSSWDSSSVSASPSEAATTVGSSREENKRVVKKDLLKLMHTSNLPQPPPRRRSPQEATAHHPHGGRGPGGGPGGHRLPSGPSQGQLEARSTDRWRRGNECELDLPGGTVRTWLAARLREQQFGGIRRAAERIWPVAAFRHGA